MSNIPFLLVAAGPSNRMGKPKQLLPWGKTTLIEHQVETMLRTKQDVYVVLGASSDLISPILLPYPVTQFIFNEWHLGMGNSISFGVRSLLKKIPGAKGILIALVDQPLITKDHYENMIGSLNPGTKQIVVSKSENGWIGPPVLFDRYYFKDLEQLQGEEGAKSIIRTHKNDLVTIDAGTILSDMDTQEAYEALLKRANLHQ